MSKVLETAWGKPEKAGIELRLLILPLDFQFGLIEASPLALLHVNAPVGQKGDAFVLEQLVLHTGPAEGKAACEAAVLEHHAVAGNDAWLGV